MKKAALLWLCAMMILTLTLTACSGAQATSTAVSIKSVTFAEKLQNGQAVNPKTQFKPTDTIWVSVNIAGRPTTGSLNSKFYYGDQLISEGTLDLATKTPGIIYPIGEDTFVGVYLSPSQPWPVGVGYRFQLTLNGTKVGDYAYTVIQ